MNIVKRVKKKDFENEVEDKQTEGYKVTSKTDTQCILEKRTLGKAIWHIIIFLITFWFTFGFGNIIYLLIAYFMHVDKITIKIEKK